MTAHGLSMSKLSTAYACSAGFHPNIRREERAVGREGRIGKITHGLNEVAINGSGPTIDDVDPHELAEAKALFDSLWNRWMLARLARVIYCEIGLRYDARNDTTTRGPRRGEPGYEDVGMMVLPGTLDLVLRGDDGVLEVPDIKTGKKQYETPWQLYAQGVAISRFMNESRVRVGYLYPRKTKCDEPEWETLDADRLDEEAGRIARVLRTLPMAEAVRGDWCWRCPIGPSYDGKYASTCSKWQSDAA